MATYECEIYEMRVCESAFAYIHGQFNNITEISNKELDLTFNFEKDKMNIFGYRDDDNKVNKRNVQVPSQLIDALLQIKQTQDTINNLKTEIKDQVATVFESNK